MDTFIKEEEQGLIKIILQMPFALRLKRPVSLEPWQEEPSPWTSSCRPLRMAVLQGRPPEASSLL